MAQLWPRLQRHSGRGLSLWQGQQRHINFRRHRGACQAARSFSANGFEASLEQVATAQRVLANQRRPESTYLRGVTFQNRQAAVQNLHVDQAVQCCLELGNPADPEAVRVLTLAGG